MRQRYFFTLIGIVIVTLLAIVTNLSGTAGFTLNLWQPVIIRGGLDLQGGARFLLQAVPQPGQQITSDDMQAARQVVESRINGNGVSEPIIQTFSSGNKQYISVEMPGLKKNLQTVAGELQQVG